jgi:hypothetical protein
MAAFYARPYPEGCFSPGRDDGLKLVVQARSQEAAAWHAAEARKWLFLMLGAPIKIRRSQER